MDDYGQGLYADLRFYYGIDLVDVVNGEGPSPALVLRLVMRLPDTSLTAALMAGGRDHFGWGADRHLMAALYDALNANTRATGNWEKGKVPTFPEWPRPASSRAEEPKRPTTVADIYARLAKR